VKRNKNTEIKTEDREITKGGKRGRKESERKDGLENENDKK
jgi:hypothetical protein